MIAGAERIGNKRTASGTEHEADCTEDHEEWHDNVDRGERFRSDKVRDKYAVHDTIDGS